MYTMYTMAFNGVYKSYTINNLDLNEYCVKNPASTFFLKLDTNTYDGLYLAGDVLVVDKSLSGNSNCWAIVNINGELCFRKIIVSHGNMYVHDENKNHIPININNMDTFEVWGVVTNVIRKLI